MWEIPYSSKCTSIQTGTDANWVHQRIEKVIQERANRAWCTYSRKPIYTGKNGKHQGGERSILDTRQH